MNTIAEILESTYSNQGIQDLKVFYDTYIFNLKIRDLTKFNNIVMIEKFSFDYDNELIVRDKNSILLNFGNTTKTIPFYSTGNSFIDSILVKPEKVILLVGIKLMTSGNIIPIVYRYDINAHTVKSVFPKPADIEQFDNFHTSTTFVDTTLPTVKYKNSRIYLTFQTTSGVRNYIHTIVLRSSGNDMEMEDYEIIAYEENIGLQILDSDGDTFIIKHNDYFGILSNGNSV